MRKEKEQRGIRASVLTLKLTERWGQAADISQEASLCRNRKDRHYFLTSKSLLLPGLTERACGG
jgi:hypothetical protein